MSEKFSLEIISPENILIKDQVSSAIIPAFEGEMTILPDHVALITFLRPGIVKFTGSKEAEYFLEEGIVEFSKNSLILLSSTVLDVKKLTKEKIAKMIDDCKSQLSKNDIDDKISYMISHKTEVLTRIN